MRIASTLAVLLTTLLSEIQLLAGPGLAPAPRQANPLDDTVVILAEEVGAKGDPEPPAELGWLDEARRFGAQGDGARGDGGGSDVSDAEAIQTGYSDPASGNVVLLRWMENVANPPRGVSISIDGARVATVDGLPEGEIPGQNRRGIANLSPGPHTFLVESQDGSFAETSINVLARQPFSDVQNLRCEAGPVNADGTCQVLVSWTNLPPFPTSYTILFNDRFLATVVGTLQRLVVGDAPAGASEKCFTVIGFLDNPQGTYQGGLVRACCTATCEDLPCNPPAGLSLWQVGYGEEGILEARWTNGEATYTALSGYVNGERAGSLPGNTRSAMISPLAPGAYTIGIQGDCGAGGVSSTAEATITVRAQTPHPAPTAGAIGCAFNEAESSTTATWTNAAPSTFIDVYVAPGGNLNNLGFRRTISGDRTTVTEAGTAPDDLIVLQFFTVVDGQCYGSEPMSCGSGPPPANQFIRGICNGAVSDPRNPFPSVTSAVFLFNYLFLEGPTPPCLEACNVDGSATANITDGIYLLTFLFLQGPPPANWVDSNSDGAPDATCETAEEATCAAAHGFCPR